MKKIAIAGVLATLAACNQTNPTAQPEATGTTQAAATPTAAAFPLQPGVYDYKRSDGLAGINTIAADGTFSNARSDGTIETGTWAQENGQTCLTPAGEGTARRCYAFTQPDADGKFTGTTADGLTVDVRKIG